MLLYLFKAFIHVFFIVFFIIINQQSFSLLHRRLTLSFCLRRTRPDRVLRPYNNSINIVLEPKPTVNKDLINFNNKFNVIEKKSARVV